MGSGVRIWGWGGLVTFAAGAAVTLAAGSCGKNDSAPITYTPPPPQTATSSFNPATIEAAEDADILPIQPVGGQQVATKMPDGQEWARYPNGMAYRDLKSGVTAQPSPGQTVYIFYKAWVAGHPDKVFAQSEKGKPWHFRLGSSAVPPGVNTAVYNMQRASKRQWWIPARLAFGEKGLPPLVGPNEDVIYEIELQQWDGKAVLALPQPREPLGPPAPHMLRAPSATIPADLFNPIGPPTTAPASPAGPSR